MNISAQSRDIRHHEQAHQEKLEKAKRNEQALIERFVQSEEVRKMVTHICGGSLSNRSLYIEVNSDVIFADHSSGERIRYLFSEHRVSPLELKFGADEVHPIFAMAQAIGFILNNEYEVVELGMIACLKLKPNKSF